MFYKAKLSLLLVSYIPWAMSMIPLQCLAVENCYKHGTWHFFFFFIMQPTLTFSSKAWFARAPLFLLACHNQPCIQLVEVFCYLDYSLVKGPQPLLNLI